MRFLDCTTESRTDYSRFSANFESTSGGVTSFFLDVPESIDARSISVSETWFLLGLTLAFSKGEDYRHDAEVCEVLLRNSKSLIDVWKSWKFGPKSFQFEARPRHDAGEHEPPAANALLYTGGVDSSFTLANTDCEMALFVNFGEGAWERTIHARDGSKEIRHLCIGNNLQAADKNFAYAWSYLTHGAALVSVAHLFSRSISRIYVSSSDSYGQLLPWGSHPLTDPLLSSRRLSVEHYGATYSRFEKIARLSTDRELLKTLTVCGRRPDQIVGRKNCSECGKCVRTMTALDICGAKRSEATAFEWGGFSPETVSKTKLYYKSDVQYFQELHLAALAANKTDIAQSIKQALRKSRRFWVLSKSEQLLRQKFPLVNRNKQLLKPIKKAVVRLVSG